jgi:hypothetical protein
MYCVLIPTTGERNLEALLDAIFADSKKSNLRVQVFIALNGELKASISHQVTIIEVSNYPVGVAATLNTALEELENNLVWIIADDDMWVEGKFLHDLQMLETFDRDFILLPRVDLKDEYGVSTRPKSPIGENQSIYEYLFTEFSLTRNSCFVTLSGSCAKREVWKKVCFRSLPLLEDIIYLKEQQDLDTIVVHGFLATVRLNVDLRRSNQRNAENLHVILSFMKDQLSASQGLRYFNNSILKPFALLGETRMILCYTFRVLFIIFKKELGISFGSVLGLSLVWFSVSIVVRIFFLAGRILPMRGTPCRRMKA